MQPRIQDHTSATFGQALTGAVPFLVHFGTDWCAPCRRLERLLAEMLSEWGDSVVVGKVNVEDHPELALAYEVTRNPTVCLFRSGSLVERREGFQDKVALLALLAV